MDYTPLSTRQFGGCLGATPKAWTYSGGSWVHRPKRICIDFYADGGVTFSGMVPRRPDDYLAIGFDYSGISDRAHGFDLDFGLPVARNFEALLNLLHHAA